MKRVGWIFYIVGTGVLLLLWFGPSYGRYAKMKREYAKLQADIVRLREQKKDIIKKIKQIEKDPGMIEEIARRRYKMGRPDEIIYVISADERQER